MMLLLTLHAQPFMLLQLAGGVMLLFLGASTFYTFSLYGPQLAARLNYSQLELSVVASAAVAGHALATAFARQLVRRSPRSMCALAATLTLLGFAGLAALHEGYLPALSFMLTAALAAMAGAGSAIVRSAVTATAQRRMAIAGLHTLSRLLAATLGLLVCIWALVRLAHLDHRSDAGRSSGTGAYLAILALVGSIACLLPMLLPQFRRVHSPAPSPYAGSAAASPFLRTPTLMPSPPLLALPLPHTLSIPDIDERTMRAPKGVYASPFSGTASPPLRAGRNYGAIGPDHSPMLYPSRPRTPDLAMLREISASDQGILGGFDDGGLWAATALLAGVALGYINTAGSMVHLIGAHSALDATNGRRERDTSMQVVVFGVSMSIAHVTLSLLLDRIFAVSVRQRQLRVLVAAAVLLLVVQICGYLATTPHQLLVVAAASGLAYGSICVVLPFDVLSGNDVTEWRNTLQDAKNRWLVLAPSVGAPWFIMLFGLWVDAYDQAERCMGGPCYRFIFPFTGSACLVALLLLLVLWYRHAHPPQFYQRIGVN
ncbi:hypothetical protein THASP1DRAFT_23566 [Thamnocephalis sphaerospora]|uniref:Major facilitator superfamily domain-containing protein n=1 Tax=Thamnocephalis sphaerospora TaxID=78915 RepID=A0A4P9XSE2_9FUNG|nr:hypothetical protein THASP1DRAFT_23566 [Thamnocephalis sphaerospora]|eukprot:RKP08451.1 hypothetical protein THASP1DRAFT_23566 [Thamnocephalis sphaerospora]